ncbi:MAG: ATP-binding cassette domain-containing protein [Kiloniellales bacterium]|nr:ATP-binding cassette domain-containing protein [Kiloniellales bacterium]
MTGSDPPILDVRGLAKVYTRGWLAPQETFRLEAAFTIATPRVVGVMGPNGSGKTTLFELITGSNRPSAGAVLCCGQDVHRVKYRERDRLAIHYHQSYQVRRFAKRLPSVLLQHATTDYPMVHLFDEPQFNTQDGYIGFMLEFFRALRARGRLVFLCVHPNEPFQVRILREICEEYIFVKDGRLSRAPSFEALLENPAAVAYLGKLAEA